MPFCKKARPKRFVGALAAVLLFAIVQPAFACEKITPNDVYSALELLNRKLSKLIDAKNIAADSVVVFNIEEAEIRPMHVYQMHLACIEQLRAYQRSIECTEVPLLVAAPRKFNPADVLMVSEILLDSVDRTAQFLDFDSLPDTKQEFSGKTPGDAFGQVVKVLAKLFALNGISKISPNEVYSQMVRVRHDAQEIVVHVAKSVQDSDLRRKLQARAYALSTDGNHLHFNESENRTPAHAYRNSIQLRKSIGKLRELMGAKASSTPLNQPENVRPADVYIQSQMIIAELNRLKMLTGAQVITKPTAPATGKKPGDVCGQLMWAEFAIRGLSTRYENASAQVN